MSDKPQNDQSAEENDERYQTGTLYEVYIHFKNMPKDEISGFLNNELGEGYLVLEIKDSFARLLWPIEHWEDIGEIEIPMFYVLDSGELGTYDYRPIDTYYQITSKI